MKAKSEAHGSKAIDRREAEAVRLAIVEDHELTRAGLQLVLSMDSTVVLAETFKSAQELRNGRARLEGIDCIVLDLGLPDGHGVDLIDDVRAWTSADIVVLSGSDQYADYARVLTKKPRAIVSKSDASAYLVTAVRHPLADGPFLSPTIEAILQRTSPHGPSLTPRQLELLTALAEGKSNKEIAYTINVALPTVAFHMGELKNKLGAQSTRQIIPKARELGLI